MQNNVYVMEKQQRLERLIWILEVYTCILKMVYTYIIVMP